MPSSEITRRAFLRSSGQLAQASCVALTLPLLLSACSKAATARLNGEPFLILDETQALEYAAIASRIVPSDESPGATEAGVVYFIDRVIGEASAEDQAVLAAGLTQLQAESYSQHGQSFFHELAHTQQDAMLGQIEQTPFFGTVRFLVVAGMFALPEYGGNRGEIGWELIGFEDRHAWLPPYGFYDADYAAKGGE